MTPPAGAQSAVQEVQALTAAGTGGAVLPAGDGNCDQAVANAISCMLADTLTRDEAVQIALLNNRRLQAELAELGIACGDLVQAGLLSNPMFEYVRQKSKKPMTLDKLEWSITLDFIDLLLLPLRQKVAASEFERVKLEVAGEVLELAFDVQSGYYELQAAAETLELFQTAVEATKASYEAAITIHGAGNISDLALHQEQAIYEEQKLVLQETETEGVELRERLNLQMGLWGAWTQWEVTPRLPRLPGREVELKGLESVAVCQRLDLAAARQQIETAGRELGMTNATSLIPELEAGYVAERETDGTWLRGGQVAFPIPIFNQGQGRIARGRARLAQAQHRYYARAVEVRSEVRTARTRMTKARERARFYEKVMLPLRTRMVEEALLQFNAMDVGVFELLQVKRDQVEAGRESILALRDYWTARSALERALGGSLVCRAGLPARDRGEQTQAVGAPAVAPPRVEGGGMHAVERPVAGQTMEAHPMRSGQSRAMRQGGNGSGQASNPHGGGGGAADSGAGGAGSAGGAGGGGA